MLPIETRTTNCINFLSKTSVTESNYYALYVSPKCCLIALFNRIIFYLFGAQGSCLGQARHPTITIQQEQQAIHAYTTARDALLLDASTQTVAAFYQAFTDREEQLYVLDPTVGHDELAGAIMHQLPERALRQKVKQYALQRNKVAEKQYKTALDDLIVEYVTTRTIRGDSCVAKINSYVSALKTYAAAQRADLSFIYKRFREDISEAIRAHNAVLDPNQKEWMGFEMLIALKEAIAQQLPLFEQATIFHLLWSVFQPEFKAYLDEAGQCLSLDILLLARRPLLKIQHTLSSIFKMIGVKYVLSGSYLFCNAAVENKGTARDEVTKWGPSDANELFVRFITSKLLESIVRHHAEKYQAWLQIQPPEGMKTDFIKLAEVLVLGMKTDGLTEEEQARCDLLITKILNS